MSIAAEMQNLMKRWQASGLSQRAFTAEQGIGYSRFQYWRRRFLAAEHDESPKHADAPTQFDPVHVVPDSEPLRCSTPFELRTSSGLSLTIPAGFDALELRRLLDVLTKC